MARTWFVAACLFGALGVIAGAFGAHGLQARLSAEALAWWETAVRYQMFHLPALLATAWLASRDGAGGLAVSGGLFVVGIVIFSGTLYAMALGAPRWFGAITPIGGVSLIAGWIALALAGWRAL